VVDDCEYAHLHKSIYGLKQAPREWHKLAHGLLLKSFPGLTLSSKDPAFYHLCSPTLTVFLTVHVDDFFLACDPPSWYQEVFLPNLRKHVSVVDLGIANHVFGMVVSQAHNCVVLSQESVILDMQERYGLVDCRPVYIPMDPKFDPPTAPTCNLALPYRNLLGELLWIARCTRPDVLFAIGKLARYSNGYDEVHWQALLRVAKYLCTTSSMSLKFTPTQESTVNFSCYVDADWAGCAETRRSTTGFIVYFCGCPLSFYSKRQKSVTVSSTEAEVYALSEALSEVQNLQQMVSEFAGVERPILVHEDNKGAITISENPVYNKKSKHIPMHRLRIRELVENGDVKISYTPSSENVADLFTKPLPHTDFSIFAKCVLHGVK
jgi:hypothetical protein